MAIYQLEERILFDGAAAADLADVQETVDPAPELDSEADSASETETSAPVETETAAAETSQTTDADESEVDVETNAASDAVSDEINEMDANNQADTENDGDNATELDSDDAASASSSQTEDLSGTSDGSLATDNSDNNINNSDETITSSSPSDALNSDVGDSASQSTSENTDSVETDASAGTNQEELSVDADATASEPDNDILAQTASDEDDATPITETSTSDSNHADSNLEADLTIGDDTSGDGTNTQLSDIDAALDDFINGESETIEDDDAPLNEIIFVNSSVPDQDALLADVSPSTEVIQIENGVDQVTETLNSREDIDAVHIISHGDDGLFLVGNDVITGETLNSYEDSIESWQSALNENADILLYGCNIAATESGEMLVDRLAELTGADVAASEDETGVSGDWELEYQSGVIESTLQLNPSDYNHDLGTITVDNNADSGEGSLRWAIAEANDETNNPGQDIIVFSGLDGSTINLTGDEIAITTPMNITTNGANIIVDGMGNSRIFNINDNSGGDISVTITGLTLQNAWSLSTWGGGAIRSHENLTIQNCTIQNSEGGYGGAIYQTGGELSIENSTIYDNSATNANGTGGGIRGTNGAIVTITNSTITTNDAARGGGINQSGGQLIINNSTIAYNSSGQTAYGGGIHAYNGASVEISSTIVANNTSSDINGSVTANYSLIENTTDATIIGSNNITGVDPMLDALADNGGPTQTHALIAGSPAIDQGINSTPSLDYDQQGAGFDRVYDGNLDDTDKVDIGAYEYQLAAIGDEYTTPEDTSFTFTLNDLTANDHDPENDPLTIITPLNTSSTLGSVNDLGAGSYEYNPNGQFDSLGFGDTATDTFEYTVRDDSGYSDTTTVTITITGVGDTAPAAVDDVADTFENATVDIDVLSNDDAAFSLAAGGLITTGTQGEVSIVGDQIHYDPNGQFDSLNNTETATDTFKYTVTDGSTTDTATVTVTINGVSEAAVDDVADTFENATVDIDVLSNDDAAFSLAAGGLITTGTQGEVSIVGDQIHYDPNGQFDSLNNTETATDTFKYTVTDGTTTDTATVTVTINGVNNDPVAVNDTASVKEDESVTVDVLANDTDPDNDPLDGNLTFFSLINTKGEVTDNNDGTFTYDPNGQFDYLNDGQTATDTFTYTVSDGNGGNDTATVTITITGVSSAPPPPDNPDTPDSPNTPIGPTQPTVPTGTITSGGDTNDGIGNTDSTPGYDSSYETGASPNFETGAPDDGTPDDLTLGDDLIADLDFNAFLSDMNDDTRFTMFTEPWQNYTSPVIALFGESFPAVGIEPFPDGEYEVNWGGALYAGLDWDFVLSLGHLPDGEYGVTPNDATGPLEDAEGGEDEFQNLLAGNLDYSQMADLDEVFDQHDSFKSDIDRILDAFVAV